MILFRAESGDIKEYVFQVRITPTGTYREYLRSIPEDNPLYCKVTIENNLEKVRDLNIRSIGLFLFGELKDALIFSSKIYHGNARIYTVAIEEQSIMHIGDMNVLDAITTALQLGLHKNDRDSFDGFCSHYWKKGKTFSPCYEYIVKQAVVQELICTTEECAEFDREYMESTFVEHSNIYRQKLLQIYRQNKFKF